jgi:hypothetical protein
MALSAKRCRPAGGKSLCAILDGLFLPRLIQQIPQPGSDHGKSPFNLLASARHKEPITEATSPWT